MEMRSLSLLQQSLDLGAISPLFHNIFSISLFSGVKLHIHLWNVVVWFVFFSSILPIWYVKIRISRSISESHLDFEIMRVDCISPVNLQSLKQWTILLTKFDAILICPNILLSDIKALTALVGWLSLSIGWENGPERGYKTVSFNP